MNEVSHDSASILRVFDATTSDELWRVDDAWHVYRGCQGDNPCIIMRKVVSEGRSDYRIYDTDGNLLFVKNRYAGPLYSSPNCEYVYADNAIVILNNFEIFDRNGNRLLPDFESKSVWYTNAFNDSTIIYTTPSEITFVSVKNGTVHKKIPSPDGQIGITPKVAIAANGNSAIINWYFTTIFVDSDFNVKWSRNDESSKSSFYGGAVSPDGEIVACLIGRYYPDLVNAYKLNLLILDAETGEELSHDEFMTKSPTAQFRNKGIKFENSLLKVTVPYSENISISKIDTNLVTRIYSFNKVSGKIAKIESYDGLSEINWYSGAFISSNYNSRNDGVIKVSRWINGQHLHEDK